MLYKLSSPVPPHSQYQGIRIGIAKRGMKLNCKISTLNPPAHKEFLTTSVTIASFSIREGGKLFLEHVEYERVSA